MNFHLGIAEHLQVGFPIAAWHNYRVLDAQFNTTNANITDPVTGATVLPHQRIRSSMICDNGQGGQMPCFDGNTLIAPRVFLGRSEPLHEGAFTSSVTLGQRVRLYGMLDFKTGFNKWDHVTRVRCALNNNCLESRTIDPTSYLGDARSRARVAAYQESDRFDEYIVDSSFYRLRELSLSYSVPQQYAQRIGASRASIRRWKAKRLPSSRIRLTSRIEFLKTKEESDIA